MRSLFVCSAVNSLPVEEKGMVLMMLNQSAGYGLIW